jgi:acyl-homoserine lactone acylase PvdQ
LENTYLFLENKFGNNMETWKWGDLHVKKLPHNLFTNTPLRYFSDRYERSNGGRTTLNLNAYIEGFEGM